MAKEILLDPHSQSILDEFKDNLALFNEQRAKVENRLRTILDDAGLYVAALESRVKTAQSLAGKLELKGSKYGSLKDITDILGLRVITFYIDDLAKVSSAIERCFDVDWANSVDKSKSHDIDSFGYLSIHYICSVPDFPYRFEIQLRTVLQHAWANMNHDTGYKSGVEVPKHYLRNLNRLAGMLELIDEQFSIIRTELTDYRRRVQALVASGNLADVPLDGDTYRSYLELNPFYSLNKRIAAINQAEIQPISLLNYLAVFKHLGFSTLGDLDKLIHDYSNAAYDLASFQLALTDLDIISSSVAPQNLCIAYILKNGGGRAGIRTMLDILNGESEANETMAAFYAEQAQSLPFMNK